VDTNPDAQPVHPDPVTGATTEVTVVVDRSPEEVWALITDLDVVGRISPERFEASWLDGATGPAIGARYHSRNTFPDGFTSEVLCRIVAATAPSSFAWEVLDVHDPDGRLPLCRWEYEIQPAGAENAGSSSVIVHRFVHGPGTTNVRIRALSDPERAEQIVAERLAELNQNMTTTLSAIFAGLP
jgi:uncharacterized protein YndB with AHSA1/START domain